MHEAGSIKSSDGYRFKFSILDRVYHNGTDGQANEPTKEEKIKENKHTQQM